MKRKAFIAFFVAALALTSGGFLLFRGRSQAADHLDPPTRVDAAMMGTDHAADIADIFAWHRGTGASQTLVTVLMFAGPDAPVAGQRVSCDRNVLYGIHIDNTGDAVAEHNIRVRFGVDDRMNCFARFEGIPGRTTALVAPVESVRTVAGVSVFAGLRDDPFFFDLQGFRTTLMTGTLSFANDRDFFSRKNTSAIVVEVPMGPTLATGTTLRVWATSARAM